MQPKITFPTECLEDIFQHLRGRVLLKCSLVCPEWNEFIGTTRSCMEKICFRILGGDLMEFAERILINSDRKYACLKIKANYREDVRRLLLAKNRKWIDVKSRLNFETSIDFLSFLQIIEPSVQKLTFYDSPKLIRIKRASRESFNLQFP